MKLIQAGVAGGCLLVLAGCGLFAERPIEYRKGAVQLPALEVPPGLSRPLTVDTYQVPQPAASGTVATVSTDIAMQIGESGVNSILIRDAYDKSWRRVGLALDALQLKVEDKDRSKGIYYLRSAARADLPRDAGAASGNYRVQVQDGGKTCSVTVTASDGISDAGSKAVLDALYKNIQP